VDLYQAARSEAHENLLREDLLPSEIIAKAGYRDVGAPDLCHPATVAEFQMVESDRAIAGERGIGRNALDFLPVSPVLPFPPEGSSPP
jgi:hypothetical protein